MEHRIGHWTNNLVRDRDSPSKWILWNPDIVVVKDRYPKAKFHFLVMPKAEIPSIFEVSAIEKETQTDHHNEIDRNKIKHISTFFNVFPN